MSKKSKILITGSRGLVGSSFIANIFNYDTHLMYEVVDSPRVSIICPERRKMNIINKKQIEKYIDKYKPHLVINFAAHRNANTAEEQRGNKKKSAWKTNVLGTKNIAELTNKYGIYLIHISTDMVFSGYKENAGPYDEKAKPEEDVNKLTWYGWTKKLGEEFVRKINKDSAVIRIANVTRPIYDPSLDYVGKILWLYDNKKLYPTFSDQFSTLTYIPHITDTILALIKSKYPGYFHVSSSNLFTPYKLSRYVLKKTRGKSGIVKSARINDYLKIKPNRYPKYGGLKSVYTQQKLGLKFLTWQQISDKFVEYVNNLKI